MVLYHLGGGEWGRGHHQQKNPNKSLEAFQSKMLCLKYVKLSSVIEQRNSDPLLENDIKNYII